jgi:hypothetical protein
LRREQLWLWQPELPTVARRYVETAGEGLEERSRVRARQALGELVARSELAELVATLRILTEHEADCEAWLPAAEWCWRRGIRTYPAGCAAVVESLRSDAAGPEWLRPHSESGITEYLDLLVVAGLATHLCVPTRLGLLAGGLATWPFEELVRAACNAQRPQGPWLPWEGEYPLARLYACCVLAGCPTPEGFSQEPDEWRFS